MIKILIVRRDNIGDLICTLPLIASIRVLCPRARIDLLVNSYCSAVVANNPDIDNVYIYTKAKHRAEGKSLLGLYLERFWLTFKLRISRYDWLILANVGYLPRPLRWARQVGAKRVVGFISEEHLGRDRQLTHPITLDRFGVRHEVEYLMELLKPFGTVNKIPSANIRPRPEELARAYDTLQAGANGKLLIGVNISARLLSQQWPAENFIELIHNLTNDFKCILFWAPGTRANVGHPGDDVKASIINAGCAGLDLTLYPTKTLDQLIAGVSAIDLLVTADGGALHIGAACNKPVVAMFGDSDSRQWYPWHVPHKILQPKSRDVRDISAVDVEDACRQLIKGL